MHVMGIDPSLASTGLALPGGTRVVRPKSKGAERLLTIRRAVATAARECDADLAVVESGFHRFPATTRLLAELGGVVRLTLYELGVPFLDVAPTTLKMFACGRGNATKDEVMAAARAYSRLEFVSDDASDAWWLRVMGLFIVRRPPFELPERHRRALAKVVVPPGIARTARLAGAAR